MRKIYKIAAEIKADWAAPNYAARPYLAAMAQMVDIKDAYGADAGHMVVRYFLANAAHWRGEKAKEIKAELKAMLKGVY